MSNYKPLLDHLKSVANDARYFCESEANAALSIIGELEAKSDKKPKCPKCGSADISTAGSAAVVFNEKNWVTSCGSCFTRWTPWQQSEIDSLRDRVKELEDILRIHQYVGIHNEFGKCPECSGINPIGHKDNCSIGKALKEKP
jgi:Zn finger protein HypA/HybF involved in hydrogenase expression